MIIPSRLFSVSFLLLSVLLSYSEPASAMKRAVFLSSRNPSFLMESITCENKTEDVFVRFDPIKKK